MAEIIQWHKSPEIEGWLNRIISPERWEFWAIVPIAAVDWVASMKAQNREAQELHKPTVASIVESMRSGQPVPPLILRRLPNGKLIVVNGNHRGAAGRELGLDSVAAYVVEVDDDTFYLMSATANAINGREAGADFILKSAAYAVSVKGFPAARVAPMFGLTAHRLNDYMQAMQGQAMLKTAGQRAMVPATKAAEIARLDQDQATYLASELAHPSVTADMVRKAITAIKSSPATRQQEVVAAQRIELAKAIESKARVTSTPRRRTEVAKVLTSLNTINSTSLAAAFARANEADKARLMAAMESAAECIEGARHAIA